MVGQDEHYATLSDFFYLSILPLKLKNLNPNTVDLISEHPWQALDTVYLSLDW